MFFLGQTKKAYFSLELYADNIRIGEMIDFPYNIPVSYEKAS